MTSDEMIVLGIVLCSLGVLLPGCLLPVLRHMKKKLFD